MTSPTDPQQGDDLRTGRWDGRHPGLEVWYQTVTDPRSGTGVWIHHEMASVAPGRAELRGHIAVFPPVGEPHLARFDPARVPFASLGRWFDAEGVRCEDTRTTGTAGSVSWDLRWHDDAPPLEILPRWTWERAPLDGAQIVPDPTATFEGYVDHPRGQLHLRDGRGAAGRIYGRGNARRWGWLHADLGDGDVLEVVTAVSRLPFLRRLPPRAFVRLRLEGRDLPRWVGSSALTMISDLDLPRWRVSGLLGAHRLRVHVHQPRDRCIEVDLEAPDGTTASCVHSARADATVLLEERAGAAWGTARRWELEATAHAEVGRTHG